MPTSARQLMVAWAVRRAACPHAAMTRWVDIEAPVVVLARMRRGVGTPPYGAIGARYGHCRCILRGGWSRAAVSRPYEVVAYSALVRWFHLCRGGLYVKP